MISDPTISFGFIPDAIALLYSFNASYSLESSCFVAFGVSSMDLSLSIGFFGIMTYFLGLISIFFFVTGFLEGFAAYLSFFSSSTGKSFASNPSYSSLITAVLVVSMILLFFGSFFSISTFFLIYFL